MNVVFKKAESNIFHINRFYLLSIISMVGLFSFLYFNFLSKWYLYDGIRWALRIESGDLENIIRIKHFFNGLWGLASYRTATFFGYQGRALPLLQILNAIVGIIGLIIFYFLVHRITKDKIISMISSFCLGFSYVYWFSSVSPEQDIITFISLIIAFYLALRYTNDNSLKSSLSFGLIVIFLLLVDVGAFLFFPVILLAIFFHAQAFSPDIRKWLRTFLIYLVAPIFILLIIGIVMIKYYSIEILGSYFNEIWWSFSLENIIKALYGMFRGFIGGSFAKEFFLSELSLVLYICIVLLVLLFVTGGFFLSYGIINRKRIWFTFRIPLSLCCIYIICCAVFFTFFAAGYYRTWGRVLIPFWLIFGIITYDIKTNLNETYQKYVLSVSIIVPVLLFFINFFGSILPQSYESNNENLQYALSVGEHTKKNDLILLSGQGGQSDGILVRHFVGNRTLSLVDELKEPERLHSKIQIFLETGYKVYFVSDTKRASTASVFESIGLSSIRYDLKYMDKIRKFFHQYGYELNVAFQYLDKFHEESILYEVFEKS